MGHGSSALEPSGVQVVGMLTLDNRDVSRTSDCSGCTSARSGPGCDGPSSSCITCRCCQSSSDAFPRGPEWLVAEPGFAPLLDDAKHIAASLPESDRESSDIGSRAKSIKSVLDTVWVAKANAYLSQYNLRLEVFCWVTTDDKGNPQFYTAIRIYKGALRP
jgi:hypothetical protein